MSKQHKIYAAIAVLALLGAGLYFVKKGEQTQLQAHAVGGEAVDLPKVKVSKDELDKLTKVEITSKDKGQVVLERRAGPAPDAQKEEKKEEKKDAGKDEAEKSHWVLSAPVKALADQENVKSLLENLEKLEIEERITGGTETYKKYELEGDKATHVVAFKGEGKVLDLYFGKSGSRGQMVRIAGKDGVWACKGYSSYLYAREIKNWRKTKIWGFEDKNAVSVAVENERGRFSFTKNDEKWNGAFYKRDRKGKLDAKAEKWERFDPEKVEDLLRAYKTLSAEDFAKEGDDTGVAEAVTSGGTIEIRLKDDAAILRMKVGKKAKGSGTSRYAQREGDDTVFVIGSWSADWAVAKRKRFEKPEEKKDDKDKDKKGKAKGKAKAGDEEEDEDDDKDRGGGQDKDDDKDFGDDD